MASRVFDPEKADWEPVDFATLGDYITGTRVLKTIPVYDGHDHASSVMIVFEDAAGPCSVLEVGVEYFSEEEGGDLIAQIAPLDGEDRVVFDHVGGNIPEETRQSIERTVERWFS